MFIHVHVLEGHWYEEDCNIHVHVQCRDGANMLVCFLVQELFPQLHLHFQAVVSSASTLNTLYSWKWSVVSFPCTHSRVSIPLCMHHHGFSRCLPLSFLLAWCSGSWICSSWRYRLLRLFLILVLPAFIHVYLALGCDACCCHSPVHVLYIYMYIG